MKRVVFAGLLATLMTGCGDKPAVTSGPTPRPAEGLSEKATPAAGANKASSKDGGKVSTVQNPNE